MARVLFLQKMWTENLGPMYLSATAKRHGHVCDLSIEESHPKNETIRNFKPDLIAFSATTGSHTWAMERAEDLRSELSIPLIIGGPHATFYPEILENSAFDFLCRGEGENAFLDLLDRMDRQQNIDDIANFWIRTTHGIRKNEPGLLQENLDDLPHPDRELYYKYDFLRKNENKSFISSRGCPYTCAYCSIASLRELYARKGTFVRFHSPERVVEEICAVKEKFGLRTVVFQDDTFILKPERLDLMMKLMRDKVGRPFICHVRADLITPEIARLLKSGGCHSVDFGVESGDQSLRQNLLGKTVTDEQIIEAAIALHDAGIKFRTTNMFGLPGEKLDQAISTVLLNQKIKTDYPSASIYQPYPRTKLGDQVIENGLVDQNYSVNLLGSSFFRSSLLQSEMRNQFINLQKFFWPAVRLPFLLPAIKKLISLRPNFVFEFIFLFFYGLNYMLSEKVSFRRVVSLGYHTARQVFFGK